MKRKQIAFALLLIVLSSAVSGFVAYHLARRGANAALPGPGLTATRSPGGHGCIDLNDAGAHKGETGCVSGRLLRVYTSRSGATFLDFCQDYRNCPFTSVIFASDKDKFGDLNSLTGRQIEIHGNITLYQGRAEIIVRGPDQIRAAP